MRRSGWDLAADVYHDIFLRCGPFETIRSEAMPCTSRARLATPYVGPAVAAMRARRRYLYQRACLLGRPEAFRVRLLARYEAFFPRDQWPDDFSHLAPYEPYFRIVPDYRAVVRETRKVMRQVEARVLPRWQGERHPGGEGGTYKTAIVDGSLVFGASLGLADPYPRSLGVSFQFTGRPTTYLHFDEDLFFVDVEAYLPLFHIPLREYERRYELLVGLVEAIRQRLAP